jgi:transcriptional regulator with GAF, ATPase, and Fis domain
LLAFHFLERAKNQLNKPRIRLTQGDIKRLQNYYWPGNIRELQNVIERAVIVSQKERLKFDLPNSENNVIANSAPPNNNSENDIPVLTKKQLQTQERENIVNALRQSKGKVFGENGAAELLGIKPTTLASKIKRYKLDRSQYS